MIQAGGMRRVKITLMLPFCSFAGFTSEARFVWFYRR